MRNYVYSIVVVLLVAAEPLAAEPPTWPQWRGPMRDGTVPAEPVWPVSLKGDALTVKWTLTDLGPSYSGPIVGGDYVYTTETVDRQTEVVRAWDRATGEGVWRTEWPGAITVPFFAARNGDWIRATPAYDGESLFVAGMQDVLVSLDARTGQENWRVDFVEMYGTSLPAFGFVSSPLVVGDSLYVQAGASVVKLDKQTGEVRWRTLEDVGGMFGSAFSSPTVATVQGQEQVLVQTRTHLAGVDPASGEVWWKQEIPAFRGMNILTPVATEHGLFTSSYGGRSSLFRIDRSANEWKSEELWSLPREGYMSNPAIIDGDAYLLLKNRRFACIDLSTGEERWVTGESFGDYWSMVSQGDTILALDQRGKLLLIEATPEEFRVIDERTVSEEETWAHLAVAGDELYIRSLNGLTAYQWR